jgi:Dienelactone hydrolase family
VKPARLRQGDYRCRPVAGSTPWHHAWRCGADRVVERRRHRACDVARGLFQRFAAFYPGCPSADEDLSWKPSAPMMILIGEDDDWTHALPCHDLAARFPDEITFVAYPGAYHDFDAPNRPRQVEIARIQPVFSFLTVRFRARGPSTPSWLIFRPPPDSRAARKRSCTGKAVGLLAPALLGGLLLKHADDVGGEGIDLLRLRPGGRRPRADRLDSTTTRCRLRG